MGIKPISGINNFPDFQLPGLLKKIVIVGGGVGGLELATKLGRSLGKKNKADKLRALRKSKVQTGEKVLIFSK